MLELDRAALRLRREHPGWRGAAGDVLLASAPLDGGRLPVDAAAWVGPP